MQLLNIQKRIYELGGQKVMLDNDLAELYEVETEALNLAVKKNKIRFSQDFLFWLAIEEWETLRSQNVTATKTIINNYRIPKYDRI